jgi:hypothetical protein
VGKGAGRLGVVHFARRFTYSHSIINEIFGKAWIFYPEASQARCEVVLVLDVDPIGLVRGKGQGEGLLDQYVNDRP